MFLIVIQIHPCMKSVLCFFFVKCESTVISCFCIHCTVKPNSKSINSFESLGSQNFFPFVNYPLLTIFLISLVLQFHCTPLSVIICLKSYQALYTHILFEYRRWLRQPQTYPIFSMLYWSTVNLMWMFCANSTTKVGQRGELFWLLIRCLSDMKLNPTKGSCCFLEVETLPSLLQYWLVPGTDSSMTSQSNVNELV